jgi:hypothetical protein
MIFWLLLLAFIFSIAVVVPSDTSAQDQVWSRPVELSSDPGGWFPDVATDRFGHVHVVWASSIRNTYGEIFDVVMYRGLGATQAWTGPVDIASLKEVSGSYATRPVLTVDHTCGFHLTYRNARGVHYKRSDQLQISTAKNWEEPQVIISYGYFSEVVEDGSGRLHLIYTTNVPRTNCSVCFHVFYRSLDNQGLSWSIPRDISIMPTGAAKPSIVVDSEDRLHVAWEAGVGGDLGQLNGPSSILYTHLNPRTQRWSSPVELSDTGVDARNVALAIDRSDRLIVAYLSTADNGIYYQSSFNHGVSWSEPVQIDGIRGAYLTALDRMDMAVDAAGEIHLVLVGRVEGQPDIEGDLEARSILHISWNGSSWSSADEIIRYVGDAPEWPAIAVGEGNRLHVVWFVRDTEYIWQSDKGEFSVWYATSHADAPRYTPVPMFTEGATAACTEPTLTGVPEAGSSATPDMGMPVPEGTLEPVETGLVQETDFILLLGWSLIPVVLLVVGAIIISFIRRR